MEMSIPMDPVNDPERRINRLKNNGEKCKKIK